MIELTLYLEKKEEGDPCFDRTATIALNRDPDALEPFDRIVQSECRQALQQAAVNLMKEHEEYVAVRGICEWKNATISPEPHGKFETMLEKKDFIAPRETYLGTMDAPSLPVSLDETQHQGSVATLPPPPSFIPSNDELYGNFF